MELVGFCHGAPFDPHTWSGSNRGVFLALKRRGVLKEVYDVEVRGLPRYWAALREFSFDKRAWRQNFLKSPYQFAIRSKTAGELLGRMPDKPDAVLQIGAMFDSTQRYREIPRFCYLDGNAALSEKGGALSFSHFASDEYKRLAHQREKNVYAQSRGIFVFSNFVRDSLIRDFAVSAERIHTVYAGVNLRIPREVRHNRKEPIILFVGKEFERKGGPLLLRAFKRVRRAIPNARLVIAGSNPQTDLPGVDVVGFINKQSPEGEARLASLFAQAAVFTMPSHFEPFGIVFAEAMHFGVPCVGVNHCAMPEIVSDGETGLLVSPNDENGLAEALIYVLKNPDVARRFGDAGRTKARELFTWDTVAGKMQNVIEQARKKACLRVAV